MRVTAAGAKSFVLNYTIAGRERRLTIGGYPAWSVAAAREQAKSLRRRIDSGEDPLAAKEADRAAATVTILCDRYLSDHASRKRTGEQDRRYIYNIEFEGANDAQYLALDDAALGRNPLALQQQIAAFEAVGYRTIATGDGLALMRKN